jgi:hypothetical protein
MMTIKLMDQMKKASQAFGNNDDTKEVVESLYVELMHKLDKHFSEYPYLLGGKPCIGGLLSP